MKQTATNYAIRANRVRLIGSDGKNLGVFSKDDAIQKAQAEGMDLIEVNGKPNPPICKIQDYGKIKYEQSKRKNKNTNKKTSVKTIKMKQNIQRFDLDRKIREANKFISKGHPVRVELTYKGRRVPGFERSLMELGDYFSKGIEGDVQQKQKIEGSKLLINISPC